MQDHMSAEEYRKLGRVGTWDEVEDITGVYKKRCKKPLNPDNPTEHQEAVMFASKLREWKSQGKILEYAHLINEMSRGKSEAGIFAKFNKLKDAGWRKGVPDYLIITPSTYQPLSIGKIVFIELKRRKGNTATPEQKAWIKAINAAGGYATVAKGATAAIEFIEGLL